MAEKEYIEREAILNELSPSADNDIHDDYSAGWSDGIAAAIDIVKKAPAAYVAPVKHGHWKKSKGNERPTENGFVHDDRYVCDCCGWGCCCETKLDFSFCPNCGAKMGGEGE